MRRNLKVAITLLVIGGLVLFGGYIRLRDFREQEEEVERTDPDETIFGQGLILAMNFCGIVLLIGGAVLLLITIFKLKDKEISLSNDDGKV